MAYEVTATRRRPQKFEDLIGQEFVAETLRNSIQSGKIAHAYLFSGPRGCGKTSTARILAKALNCEKGPTATPCGTCSACTEITKGSSLDVIEIDGASNTSVNDVRQIKDEVLFPPNSCRYKIYIIDEVHMLSTSAFNALLKTIEEPPPYVIFIFATTELQKVPATIKSRCQQFNFRLVPIEKVKEQLAKAAEEIGLKADEEALYWIARESTGSMRDAYTLFDQVAAFSDGVLTYDKIRDKLGLVGVDRLNELFTLCAKEDAATALTKLDEYLQNGVSIEQLISNCTDYLRSLLLIKNGITKEALLGQSSDRYAKEVLASWNSIQIERALDIFLQLYRDIRYSLNQRYELELAVSRLCWLKEYVSAAEVKKAVDAVKPILAAHAGSGVVQQAAVPAVAETASIGREASSAGAGTSATGAAVVQQTKPLTNAAAAPQQPLYVPHFSALDNASTGGEGGGSNAPGGGAHPFLDGGAVPPVNNTAAGAMVMPGDFCSPDSGEYEAEEGTYAPDTSDDGSFTPDDSAFDSDTNGSAADSATNGNATDGVSNTSGAGIVSQATGAVLPDDLMADGVSVQNSRQITDGADATVEPGTYSSDASLNSLCAAMISDFSVNDPLTASALSHTKRWTRTGDSLNAVTDVAFEKMQLQNDAPKIATYLSKKLGHSVSFTMTYEEKKVSNEKKVIPPEVQILCDTFRGTIIAGA